MALTMYTTPMSAWAATDAGFRIWGKAWTDMMDTLGMTQVYSDIDWTTVTMPTTAVVWAGKRVYRFNDSASSTREIYVTFEFGRTSTTTAGAGFGLRVTVGTQHTSGTVTGYVMTHYLAMTQTTADGGDIIGVRSDAGFSIFTNINMGTPYQGGVAVERLCENGSITPDGAVLMLNGACIDTASSNAYSAAVRVANYAGGQVFAQVGAQSSGSSSRVFENISAIPNTVDPSYAGKAPAITMDTFGKYDPCYHWIGVSKYLYSPSAQFTATINGVAGTWRTPATGFLMDNGAAATNRILVALRVG